MCFFAITLLCFGLRYVCSFAQINICTSNTNLMMCSVCSPIIYFMFSNHISHLHQSYFQSNAAQSSDVSSVFLASAATAGKQPFVSIHLLTQQSQSTLLISFLISDCHQKNPPSYPTITILTLF